MEYFHYVHRWEQKRRDIQAVARDQLNTTQLFWGASRRDALVLISRAPGFHSIRWRVASRRVSFHNSSLGKPWWLCLRCKLLIGAYDVLTMSLGKPFKYDDWWRCLRWRLLIGTCMVFIKNVPKCASEFIVRLWMKQIYTKKKHKKKFQNARPSFPSEFKW